MTRLDISLSVKLHNKQIAIAILCLLLLYRTTLTTPSSNTVPETAHYARKKDDNRGKEKRGSYARKITIIVGPNARRIPNIIKNRRCHLGDGEDVHSR